MKLVNGMEKAMKLVEGDTQLLVTSITLSEVRFSHIKKVNTYPFGYGSSILIFL
jgi:hypothetical protein